jgi:hypothetical protein
MSGRGGGSRITRGRLAGLVAAVAALVVIVIVWRLRVH